ncbi:hypothetical protein MANES_05G085350v8 [Manihot esculenta]|uniref:Uncharacterized protein n=1 Tax=Manihot esculenta TaxID=3983 RepID=A0ACB7HPQ5_MANES|nr:hypothetical protein MANES_05G085350v8 [Manihot esculenta]
MTSSSGDKKLCLFLEAAFSGDLKLMKTLSKLLDVSDGFLAKRVESIKDHDGRTALHLAAEQGKTNVCEFLIGEVKMDVNLRDRKGNTPLHCAILEDHSHIAASLLENGANPNAATGQKFTPLHYAAKRGCRKVLQLLISKGAEIDAQADSGTPLQEAASLRMDEAVKILLDNNANPNLTFRHLFSPLLLSLCAGSIECVKQLLKAGADPNMRTVGPTPLEYAASLGDTESIKYLLDEGALPNMASNLGLTPVEVAARQGHHSAVEILFPVTSSIASVADWSCAGIMKHFQSIEVKKKMEQRKNEQFVQFKSKGQDAFNRKDYHDGIYWYTEAECLEPMDARVKSNRSLCWACLNEGYRALADGQKSLLLDPKWQKAYYREGVGWKLLKDFEKAADSFYIGWRLDVGNKELLQAYQEAKQMQIQQAAAREPCFDSCCCCANRQNL